MADEKKIKGAARDVSAYPLATDIHERKRELEIIERITGPNGAFVRNDVPDSELLKPGPSAMVAIQPRYKTKVWWRAADSIARWATWFDGREIGNGMTDNDHNGHKAQAAARAVALNHAADRGAPIGHDDIGDAEVLGS